MNLVRVSFGSDFLLLGGMVVEKNKDDIVWTAVHGAAPWGSCIDSVCSSTDGL